jgi:hypothetical protein
MIAVGTGTACFIAACCCFIAAPIAFDAAASIALAMINTIDREVVAFVRNADCCRLRMNGIKWNVKTLNLSPSIGI